MTATVLLQDLPAIWQQLADKGLIVVLLGVAVYVLWKRDSAMNNKMNKYLDEDRKEMLQVITNNTKAFQDLNHTMQDLLTLHKQNA